MTPSYLYQIHEVIDMTTFHIAVVIMDKYFG